ncbi:hypothetical protein [Parvularcula dongshanensis]|uniref:Uncharacterized protein n=1 Tax=Parvularcula dongshanensis TaxID=1173995 RepID=A0A840I7K9_9PROT|nr:hypothetical protein [Parvularcula dongshanensis]MBB4660315.1 hypothetical protein [Parvularcula dongshanensis]
MLPISTSPLLSAAEPMKGGQDLKEAAQSLHKQFLLQMLKDAKLGEALGAKSYESAALSHVALHELAGDLAAGQPALADRLYEALARTEGS